MVENLLKQSKQNYILSSDVEKFNVIILSHLISR